MQEYQQQLMQIIFQHVPNPTNGAEIGVSDGGTSKALLGEFPMLRLHMVDPWTTFEKGHDYYDSGDSAARRSQKKNDNVMSKALQRTQFASARRVVHRSYSSEAAAQVVEQSLDFAFIDGDHTYEAVQLDLQLWSSKVRPGGLLCGHDCGHPRDKRGLWGVARAVHEFAEPHSLVVKIGAGTIWWIHPL